MQAMRKPPKPTSRRLLAAAALAVLCSGVLTAVVATSGSTDGSAPAGAGVDPQTGALLLPPARLGERGAYSLFLAGFGATPFDAGAAFLQFAWEAGGPLRTGDGLVHDTDRVVVAGTGVDALERMDFDFDGQPDGDGWSDYRGTVAFEGGAALAWETDLAETIDERQDAARVAGIPVPPSSKVRVSVEGGHRSFEDLGPACLFGFGGLKLVPGGTVPGGPGCGLGNLLLLGPGPWTVGDWAEVDGRMALPVRVPSALAGTFLELESGFTVGEATLWFTPGITVPVAVALDEGTRVLRMTLVGYEPGTTDRTPAAAPRDPAPAIVYGKRNLWGPDDAGVTFEWSPRQAFEQAMADPSFPGLRSFLAEHPEAKNVVTAFFAHDRPAWLLEFADATATYTLLVSKARLDTPIPVAPDSYVESSTSSPDGGLPVPDDRLPTWASLAATWSAYSGKPADDATSFTMWTVCLEGLESCFEQGVAGRTVTTGTGRQPDLSAFPPGFSEDVTQHSEAIVATGDRVTGYVLMESARQERPAAAPTVLPEPDAATLGVPEGLHAAWMPDAGQAAGISLAGLLAGLAYYLWPVAKAGVLGLFSRVEAPRLAEHPQRARILHALDGEPGLHFRELQRRTGLSNGTLVHHLRQLQAGGLVAARQANGYTCYFVGTPAKGAAAAAAATRSEGAQRLLAVVAAAPGLTSQDAAARAGLQPSTVTYHVQRLVEAGQVMAVRDGRTVRLHPAAGAAASA